VNFQTLTFNRGWVETVKNANGALSDDKVIAVNVSREVYLSTVHATENVSSLYRVFNRESKYFSVVPANTSVYTCDTDENYFNEVTDVLTSYPNGATYFPTSTNVVSFKDGSSLNFLKGTLKKEDKTIQKITKAVSTKDVSLKFLKAGAEVAKEYLNRWRDQYGAFFAPDSSTAASLQGIFLELGIFSTIRRSNAFEVKPITEHYFKVTDAEDIKNGELQLLYDRSGERVYAFRREVNTGMIFIV